jgi:N utilization substance protein A
MSELGGEKIDIIEWSADQIEFIEDALSPAQVLDIKVITEPNEETKERGHVAVEVSPDQQSLAIGRGGQNVRLAAKLTGWKIDIVSAKTGDDLAEADPKGMVDIVAPVETEIGADLDALDNEDATTTKPDIEEILMAEEATQDRDLNPDSEEENPIDTPEEAEAASFEAPIIEEKE